MDRLSAVSGAAIFSQGPMYVQEYAQQLYGHIAELQYQIDKVSQTAQQHGENLQEYIKKLHSNSDPEIQAQGIFLDEMIKRLNTFTEALANLQSTDVWKLPYVFFENINWNIAQDTLNAYEPGLPITAEGTLYTIFGLIIGYFSFVIIRKSFKGCLSLAKRVQPSRK